MINIKKGIGLMKKKRKNRGEKESSFLLAEIVILAVLLAVGYVILKYDKFQVTSFDEGDIKVNEGANQEGYTTVALFGGDSREGQLEEGTHADCIIVATIDNQTKEVKMVSVYRDTLTEQMNGEIKKANNAYFTGGPQDAINMLNKNLDLDIQNYVTVDFKALADTVDLLGGIEVDIKEEEVQYMNEFLEETAQVLVKKRSSLSIPVIGSLTEVRRLPMQEFAPRQAETIRERSGRGWFWKKSLTKCCIQSLEQSIRLLMKSFHRCRQAFR